MISGGRGKDTVYITEDCTLTGKSIASLGRNQDQVIVDGIIHKLKIDNGDDAARDMVKISNIENIKNKLRITNFGKEDRLILEEEVFQYNDLNNQTVKKAFKEMGIVFNLLDV